MARTFAWRSAAAAALVVAAFACREEVTAPGKCPELCPADSLLVEDTLFTGIVFADTSIRGYTRVDFGPVMVVASLDSLVTYGVAQFLQLPQRWFPVQGETTSVAVGSIDSVALELRLDARDTSVNNTRVLVYQLPARVDSTWNYDSVATYLGGPFDSITVPDSLRTTNLRQLLPAAFVPPQEPDSFELALAFGVRGDSATAALLLSSESGAGPVLRYYLRGAAPNDTFTTTFATVPTFDTYVRTPEATVPAAGTIVVGEQPAARAFVRFNIPSYYIDSISVLRATLELELTRPATGLPGEQFVIEAQPILRYLAGKSIILQDTSGVVGTGTATVGVSGTFPIEMARILRVWRFTHPDSVPRAIALRSAVETSSFGQIVAAGAGAGANAPRLRLSFVRPFRFGVP